ncbi:MAG: hypothetical protein IJT49_05580 [Clostridia bacterium]|nr:hypothetical protein [Clostridia bacterium]
MERFKTEDLDSNVIITVGHFGCGKTNVSVNLAEKSAERVKTYLIDYDNVNPYFRSADVKDDFKAKGIEVIASDFANSNVDIPSVSPLVFTALTEAKEGARVIFDVGGDMLGAVSLGFLHDRLAELHPLVIYVFSAYRPLTDTPEKAYEILKEIEVSCKFKVNALVNNSNLGAYTQKEDVEASEGYAEKICEISGVPLLFTSYIPDIVNGKPAVKSAVLEMKNMTKKLF